MIRWQGVTFYQISSDFIRQIESSMKVHIGKEIKAELQRQERGATWLADKLHCDRTNVYNIFRREGIDTRLLERISIILNRNFFTLYCQDGCGDVENNTTDL